MNEDTKPDIIDKFAEIECISREEEIKNLSTFLKPVTP